MQGLLVLTYHGIGKDGFIRPSYCVSENNFERQVKHLARHYRVLPLERAVQLLEQQDTLPHNSVAITIDDGYRNAYEKAFPILKKYGCPATVFAATEPLQTGKSLWPNKLYLWFKATRATHLRLRWRGAKPNEMESRQQRVFRLRTKREREEALDAIGILLHRLDPMSRDNLLTEIAEDLGFGLEPDPREVPMLTWDQLREMAQADITIGSHSITHPVLTAMSLENAKHELVESKAILERELNRPITLFAYPFGGYEDFNAEIQAMVEQAGYHAAFTAVRGLNHKDSNRFTLFRMQVPDTPPSILALKFWRVTLAHSIREIWK